jgi:glycosyltransferase involved in cell wall biosynthesis
MKILYVHQHFSTPSGSGGTRSYEMAQQLIKRGHTVLMLCGCYQGAVSGLTVPFKLGIRRGMVDNIEVLEFELPYSNSDSFLKRTFLFVLFALKSTKVCLTEKYDLLFATTTPLTAGIPGIFSRWLRFKPFVFEVRDLWPELPRAMGVITNPVVLKLMGLLEWISYRSANRIIGLSPGIVDGIKKCGVRDDRVTMISNGCDLSLFYEVEPKKVEGVGEDDLLAIFTGAHGIANGIDAALDAAHILKKRGRTDIKFCFIGTGKLKPDLIKRAQHEKFENCIFIDPVPKTKLAAYLKGADIGMQLLKNVPAFYYGTSPNKFFDYIATGLPVLNNYPGWLSEMIQDNQCGFTVPPDDAGAFADALEMAAGDRGALKKMGNNSRKLAEEQFDRKHLAGEFVDWLDEGARL